MPSQTAYDILRILSLAEFGAVGKDIYGALVRANAQAAGSGVIWIPPGSYSLVTSFSPSAGVAVWISAGVTLSGAGVLSPGEGMILDLRSGLKVNGLSVVDLDGFAAAEALTAKRFVDVTSSVAQVDSVTVIGIAPSAIASAVGGAIASAGLQAVTADAPLTAADNVKVGTGGRATKHTTSQTTLQTTITGEATAFVQPVGATALEILQAADVATDRGRGIVIEGSDGAGAAITETISLDATDTTTPVAGATSFTKISAVYTANGANLGAQNVTVRASGGGATVCTLAGGSSELGADIPAQTREAYCNELTIAGPDANTTFVTVVGIDSTDATARERVQLDGSNPSVVTTTTVFRYVERICLGEFTNAATGSVKTNAATDAAGMKCGVVVAAAAARGDDALILVKPNV